MTPFAIARDALDARSLEGVARPGDGGAVTFVGIVRDRSEDGRAVSGLSYEAFEPMALREFEAIASDVRDRFGDVALGIVHRTGVVRAGEVAVVVAAAAPHRAAAFAACEYAIDELKRRAPIWKKEAFADGDARWKENVQG